LEPTRSSAPEGHIELVNQALATGRSRSKHPQKGPVMTNGTIADYQLIIQAWDFEPGNKLRGPHARRP
jgi:hypothetical protein